MGGHLAPVLVQSVCRHGHCNTGVERELRTFIIHHKISRYLQGKLQFPALEINNTAVSTLLSHPGLGSLDTVSRTGQAVTNDNPISRNISIIGPIICLMSPPALSATLNKDFIPRHPELHRLLSALRRKYRKNATSK